ncbi:hypothetical protein RB653_003155 [Dictyostelium firmibasis]|uniref:Cytochrome P450 n=1 Tax=Dictyostelium firmibasis TaxID=79012 RepID=A0AAN7TXV6_9MYCE
MSIIIILIFTIFFYFVFDFLYKNFSNRQFKGPLALPLVGSLLHLKDDTHLVFQKDSKLYGNDGKIIKYWFCDKLTLAIFDVNTMREIYLKNPESLNTRVKSPSTNVIGNRFRGIVTADENYWQFHRDILMKSFTGRKVKSLSSSIEKETNHLISYMKFIEKSGQSFSPRSNFMNFYSNIIFDYVFSRRIENIYEGANEEQGKVLIAIRELFDYLADTLIVNYLMFTKPFYFLYLKIFGHPADPLKKILTKYYLEHSETIDLNNARDVLDSLIIEYRKVGGKEEESSIIPMANELILAGTETNSSTAEWFILTMVNHQDYQEKIYNELSLALKSAHSTTTADDDSSTTTDKHMIKLSNRNQTPLFNAALKEVLRLYPPVPFGVPREVNQSFEINGGSLKIPKGTQIIQSLYSTFRDKNYWDSPDEFKPERFLDDSHSNNYYPYGIGVRNCIGMGFSQDELYISLSNLILNFKLLPLVENSKICDSPIFGFSFKPVEFKISLKQRN